MAIAIEMHCNDDMLMQRLQHINKHKEHKKTYEKKSIYPWKYYWNPDNSELMKFIAGCAEVTLGRQYMLSEMIDIIISTAMHKIHTHAEEKEDIMGRLTNMLETPRDKMDLYNGRSFQYPLMSSICPVTYEEAWKDRYPHEVKLSKENYSLVYQPDWNVPMWCKPSLGPIPLGPTPRRGQLNIVISNGPEM
jgi:hypothetical protein